MEEEKVRLTQYSRGGGCGCKIAPSVLEEILKTTQSSQIFENLLVGNSSKDDAAVYMLDANQAVISTTDFFMPIVDDAFDFGRIAAANAISDVYAMGGKPIMAIAVLGWPIEKLPVSLAQQVLEGARLICAEAGIPLAGGHSIDSAEPFFGLSVNGLVQIPHLKKNNTARHGDVILLTKPLGSGVLSTAQKRSVLKEALMPVLLQTITQLNKVGEALASIEGVHALTDVTGFGLLGHLFEMADGSSLNASINYNQLPVMEGVRELIAERVVPDSTFRNWNTYNQQVKFEKGVNVMEAFSLLPDPQTNGGLLIAVAPQALEAVQQILKEAGLRDFIMPIGQFTNEAQEKRITIM